MSINETILIRGIFFSFAKQQERESDKEILKKIKTVLQRNLRFKPFDQYTKEQLFVKFSWFVKVIEEQAALSNIYQSTDIQMLCKEVSQLIDASATRYKLQQANSEKAFERMTLDEQVMSCYWDVDVYKLKRALSLGGNPDAIMLKSSTVLHMAALYLQKEIVKTCIEHKADLNKADSKGRTALHFAMCGRGPISMKQEIVTLLLENHAKVDPKNEKGHTPLYMAIENNVLEIVELLLKFGADPNVKTISGETALHLAVTKTYSCDDSIALGNLDIVEALCQRADVNIQDQKGNSALHLALMDERYEIAKILIDKGACLTLENNEGRRPLELVKDKEDLGCLVVN